MGKGRGQTGLGLLLLLTATVTGASVQNQEFAAVTPSAGLTYADLVDLGTAAPIVARVTIAEAIRLKGADVAGLPAGTARLFARGQVTALLKGAGGLAPAVSWLVDVPLDGRGRPPKLRKAQVLLFAAPAGGGDAGALRLATRDAQLGWTPDIEARVRGVLVAAADPQAPPRITGVGNAFHVAGVLPGEGETQIFLTTADGRPVSLAVLRRPQEQPRWAVALAEMVDEAAGPPPPDSLLWYHLACELPRALPDASLAGAAPEDAAAAKADYQIVLTGLGPCARSRARD